MMDFLEKADEYVEVVRNIKNPNKGIYALEEVQLTVAFLIRVVFEIFTHLNNM